MKRILLLSTVPLAALLVGPVESKKNGILPTSSRPLTRDAGNSCGSCHSGSAGGVSVRVTPTQRSLAPQQSISITVAGVGGPGGSEGGMAADVTAGQLIAGANTRVSTPGDAIAHSNPGSRSWTFGYRAPAAPGPVEFYTVVNAVDGNGRTSGDRWAFHGADPNAAVSTPVRLFVNAPGVTSIGVGCADGYGNVGVYGASESPRVGNANFKFEAVGLPPSARVLFMLGLQKNLASVDLAPMGAAGCFLHTDMVISAYFTTTGGSPARAEGRFVMPAPIPGMATLKGFFLRSQLAVIDGSPDPARSLYQWIGCDDPVTGGIRHWRE
jgi:hypothetical protein